MYIQYIYIYINNIYNIKTSPNESRITSGISTPKNSAAKAAELNMMDELQERFNQLNLLKAHSNDYSRNKNFIKENRISVQKKSQQKVIN